MNASSYGQEESNVTDFVGQPTRGGPPAWGMDEVLTTPHRKEHYHVTKRSTLMNQNSIQEEIKSRLKSGNACYHSVRNLLSSSLVLKNFKIKIYITIILPVVVYGCET